jgi:hypothetical protein
MSFAVKVYEAFKDDEVKAKVLAEFIESVEQINRCYCWLFKNA